MGKIIIKTEMGVKEIKYELRIAKGIYYVEEKNAKRNCKLLEIKFKKNALPTELQQRVTKIGNYGFLSIKILGNYIQYILHQKAGIDDFEEFVNDLPQENHKPIRTAYNLLKINNLDEMDMMNDVIFGGNDN